MISSSLTKSDRLTECGRVYCIFNQENTNLFTLSCVLCNRDFTDWIRFCKHFKGEHQLENARIENTNRSEQQSIRNAHSGDRFQQEKDDFGEYYNIEYLDEEFSCSSKEMRITDDPVGKNFEDCNRNKVNH